MSLAAMQEALEAPNKCTYILVKLEDGADVDAVAARIDQALPGNKINLTRELVIDAQERIPGLNTLSSAGPRSISNVRSSLSLGIRAEPGDVSCRTFARRLATRSSFRG